MATEAQIEANRANAQKSTGPRTPEGKETASQNALKHGLFARETVIRGEDEQEFEEYRNNVLDQLVPGSPLEEILADRVVDLSWRLKRAAQDQEKAFVALYEKYVAGQAAAGPDSAGDAGIPSASPSGRALPANPNHGQDAHATAGLIGRMILEDFCGQAVLERLQRYERRIENSLYRTLKEMRRVFDRRHEHLQEVANTLERWREEDWESQKARAFARGRSPEVSPPPAGPPKPGWVPPIHEEVFHPSTLPSFQNSPAAPAPEGSAGDETRKTKPILEEVSRVKCQGSSETRKTNPMCGGGSSRQGGYTPIFRRRG